MSPRFVLGRENVPCVAEVVNRSLKADCTDFTSRPTDFDAGQVVTHSFRFDSLTHQTAFGLFENVSSAINGLPDEIKRVSGFQHS